MNSFAVAVRNKWPRLFNHGDDERNGREVMRFKPGDVVSLKSGGTRMTVKAVKGTGVVCLWWDGSKMMGETFPPETLVECADAEDGKSAKGPWAST